MNEELKEMKAHTGQCTDCEGPVKMLRDPVNMHLLPDQCFCLQCGKTYFMTIEDIHAWEMEQWEQKRLMNERD